MNPFVERNGLGRNDARVFGKDEIPLFGSQPIGNISVRMQELELKSPIGEKEQPAPRGLLRRLNPPDAGFSFRIGFDLYPALERLAAASSVLIVSKRRSELEFPADQCPFAGTVQGIPETAARSFLQTSGNLKTPPVVAVIENHVLRHVFIVDGPANFLEGFRLSYLEISCADFFFVFCIFQLGQFFFEEVFRLLFLSSLCDLLCQLSCCLPLSLSKVQQKGCAVIGFVLEPPRVPIAVANWARRMQGRQDKRKAEDQNKLELIHFQTRRRNRPRRRGIGENGDG